jgi:hypothetical protein
MQAPPFAAAAEEKLKRPGHKIVSQLLQRQTPPMQQPGKQTGNNKKSAAAEHWLNMQNELGQERYRLACHSTPTSRCSVNVPIGYMCKVPACVLCLQQGAPHWQQTESCHRSLGLRVVLKCQALVNTSCMDVAPCSSHCFCTCSLHTRLLMAQTRMSRTQAAQANGCRAHSHQTHVQQ